MLIAIVALIRVAASSKNCGNDDNLIAGIKLVIIAAIAVVVRLITTSSSRRNINIVILILIVQYLLQWSCNNSSN